MKQLVILAIVLLGTLSTTAQTEQLTVPLTNPGKPYTLDVNLLTGTIHVTTYAGSEIVIDAVAEDTEKDDREDREGVEGMKRLSRPKGYEITADENNNVVTVHNSSFEQAVKLNIKVPQQMVKLKLNTVNQGELKVENITGELELNNINGPITVTSVSGSVVATTVDGEISVTFKSVDPNAAMAFSSLSGDINIVLPPDIKANLKLKSDMGEIYSDFDIAVDKGQPKVDRVSEAGMHKLSVDDWIYGKINGGGSEIMMKNMDGDILIRKLK